MKAQPQVAPASRPDVQRPPVATQNRFALSPGVAALLIAVALGMFLLVWFVAGRTTGSAGTVRSAVRPVSPGENRTSREAEAERTASDDPDPIVDESRRLIDSASRHAGLPPPPTSPDGMVHLRGGGSITPEQYLDAERHVEDSPVRHGSIAPPATP